MLRLVRSYEQISRQFTSPLKSVKTRGLNSGSLLQRGAGRRNRQIDFPPRNVTPEPLLLKEWKFCGPVLFTVGFSGVCFCGAAIWEYENYKKSLLARKKSLFELLKAQLDWKSTESHSFNARPATFKEFWASLTDGEKIFWSILSLNTAVFLAWMNPELHPVLETYFWANPFTDAVCWPMVLSTFSHSSLLHMGFNMYSLHTLSVPVAHSMGKEQFLAFYLSTGVFSSLFSYLAKIASGIQSPTLGASGAVMGVFAYFASSHSEAEIQLALAPGSIFPAYSVLMGLILVEVLGLLLGWGIVDHAAHLGGALFGMFWYHWGQRHIWGNRRAVRDVWDQVNPI